MEWLEWAATEDEESFLKYLLSLEREMYIFLSILNPPIARPVLKASILAYGQPTSRVYGLKKSVENLNSFMTLLRIVIRALQRVGNKEDLPDLKRIQSQREKFLKLKDDPHYHDMVTRILGFSDKAIQAIEKRAGQDTTATI